MNVSATLPPPPEVCHGPSQTENLCLWTSLCRPACCPFCPFLSRGSQRSRDVFLLQTRHRPCAADSSPLGPWWSPARISGEGKKLWLRSKAFTAYCKRKKPPTQTFLPWPCALHWPETQPCSCDELFQSRPSAEKKPKESCELPLKLPLGIKLMEQSRCCDVCVQPFYSLPWRWPWMTLSLYPWETKWEASSGLSSSLMQRWDPQI